MFKTFVQVWRKRSAPVLTMLALCAAGVLPVQAQGATPLLFAVSEGSSGGGGAVTNQQMATKYKPLIDVMERELGEKIQVRYVRDFRQLEEGMKSGQFDLVLARPSDYPARGLRDYGYASIATTQPDGHCLIVVNADSPLKTLEDAKGKRLILPEPMAYMAKFCAAELRDQGQAPDPATTTHVREQGAIPFALKNGLVQVGGIASYSGVARRLEKEGLRVLHRSRPQPYLPLIAHGRIDPERKRRLGQALIALTENAQAAQELAAIGLTGFDTSSSPRLLSLLDWLGDKPH
ncbi:MAG: phosphate/phosphite/phosphonate ABC transporter substrate-binding protein [Pseudomonadota bacterium]|nr:phosphate/phosphite/phosphonate ABC transporter substrate-binding protein [Pseudomonadota bacterium]